MKQWSIDSHSDSRTALTQVRALLGRRASCPGFFRCCRQSDERTAESAPFIRRLVSRISWRPSGTGCSFSAIHASRSRPIPWPVGPVAASVRPEASASSKLKAQGVLDSGLDHHSRARSLVAQIGA